MASVSTQVLSRALHAVSGAQNLTASEKKTAIHRAIDVFMLGKEALDSGPTTHVVADPRDTIEAALAAVSMASGGATAHDVTAAKKWLRERGPGGHEAAGLFGKCGARNVWRFFTLLDEHKHRIHGGEIPTTYSATEDEGGSAGERTHNTHLDDRCILDDRASTAHRYGIWSEAADNDNVSECLQTASEGPDRCNDGNLETTPVDAVAVMTGEETDTSMSVTRDGSNEAGTTPPGKKKKRKKDKTTVDDRRLDGIDERVDHEGDGIIIQDPDATEIKGPDDKMDTPTKGTGEMQDEDSWTMDGWVLELLMHLEENPDSNHVEILRTAKDFLANLEYNLVNEGEASNPTKGAEPNHIIGA